MNQIENYRKDGIFHVRLCYEELSQHTFPCNEWTQSSNFAEETKITDFIPIEITLTGPSDDLFPGLKLSSSQHALITAGNYWFGIGGQFAYNWGLYGPFPDATQVQKLELYLAISMINKQSLAIYSL